MACQRGRSALPCAHQTVMKPLMAAIHNAQDQRAIQQVTVTSEGSPQGQTSMLQHQPQQPNVSGMMHPISNKCSSLSRESVA